jgi:hypothetical protein
MDNTLYLNLKCLYQKSELQKKRIEFLICLKKSDYAGIKICNKNLQNLNFIRLKFVYKYHPVQSTASKA